MPRDRRAPIVADHNRRLLTKRIQYADGVRSVVPHGVALDYRWRIRPAIAPDIRRYSVVPGFRKRRKLVAPGVPQLGEAVQEEDKGTLARLGDVHLDAVGVDGPMTDVRYGLLLAADRAAELKRQQAYPPVSQR